MVRGRNGNECYLVALEGADRVGKATQASRLETALKSRGLRVTVEEIPYKDEVTHREIYRMLHDGTVRHWPQIFQTLHGINRRLFQANYLPTLAAHFDVLILDRWTLSTRVYGGVDGISEEATDHILRDVVMPDLTIVIDAPAFPRKDLDMLEADAEFQAKVRAAYLRWCEKDPVSFVKIDGGRSVSEVHLDILAALTPHLHG